jgi:stress-induced morphogen
VAKIEQSLTPGRNNGFLNMLKVMKDKALSLDAKARQKGTVGGELPSSPDTEEEFREGGVYSAVNLDGKGPKYKAIVQALEVLKPTSLELVDNSHQHAGHAGNNMGDDGESHFELTIVAPAFEGLNLVKRHKLIYMVLGKVMPQIHALQIRSLTPEEAERQDH